MGQGRERGGKAGAGGTPGSHLIRIHPPSVWPGVLTTPPLSCLGPEPLPYVAPSAGVPPVSFQEERIGGINVCRLYSHTPCVFKESEWDPVHLPQPTEPLAPRGQSPHPTSSPTAPARGYLPMPTPACLPPPLLQRHPPPPPPPTNSGQSYLLRARGSAPGQPP